MRILIVEDNEALAGLIARFLGPIAAQPPVIAHTMAEAMEVINGVSPLDLVTLDLALPDSTTDQTLQRIKEIKAAKPDALLVVVTGAMRPEQEEQALAAGADGFMHKTLVCRDGDTFLGTLRDIGRSILRQPVRYQKNLPILEKLTEKICQHVTCNFTPNPKPQSNP